MESSSVISPNDVLESLMNDGTIDALRLKIINQLKANSSMCFFCRVGTVCFNLSTLTDVLQVNQSLHLFVTVACCHSTAFPCCLLTLLTCLKLDLWAPVLEKASKSVWDLILDDNGLGKEISETVEKVFCRLSGREPPLYPASTSEALQQEKEQDENPASSSKKRSFNEIIGVEKVERSDDATSASEDRNPVTDIKT
uniref:Uncharacterized protein n=1 Tax=Chenopodium quinoa TaxID=63459 RepID=A0A803N6P2_CHEQI